MSKNKKKRTILLVDGDESPHHGIKRILRESEFNILIADNGLSGLETFKKLRPPVVITDIEAPIMSGLELLKAIHEIDEKIPVIILSAVSDTKEVFENGAFRYLKKPIKAEELRSCIKEALHYSPMESQIAIYEEIIYSQDQMIDSIKKEIEQLTNSLSTSMKKTDKYENILLTTAHNLRGHFLLINNATKIIREEKNDIDEIREAWEMIDRIVKFSMIRYRRIQDNIIRGVYPIEQIDSRKLVEELELLVRPRLSSNIDFQVNINPEIKNPLVSGNIEQLMGVVIELIENAQKALDDKTIDGGTILLTLEEENSETVIAVTDNGNGIPENVRGQLFNQQVTSQDGLGMGIYLSSKIIRELGGKLILKNTSEKGTTFSVILPKASDRNDKKEN